MADRNGVTKEDQNEEGEQRQLSEKANEYIRELMQEKLNLDENGRLPNAQRLLDQEIQKTQASGRPIKDFKYVDIYREKPIKVSVKVLVPVREHPKFNFVGKLLGPKGNSMKRLQEETMCKMAVLGRGSMRDRQKEEDLRKSMDPKYAHLFDDLHVEIMALAPPAEAHARIAFALAEVRKYLIPDNNDVIRQEQMREMELGGEEPMEERRPTGRGGILRPAGRPPGPPGPPPRGAARPILPPPPPVRPPVSRPVPAKTKVFSILDRARVAMDQSYGYKTAPPAAAGRAPHLDYDYPVSSSGGRYGSNDGHHVTEEMYPPPPSSRYGAAASAYDYEEEPVPHGSSHDYYDAPDYPVQRSMKFEDSSSRAWKSYKTTTTGAGGSAASSRYRATPYARPAK
ncbi:KH domain-containing, RNA-binding, signal transduction-associated protein 2-like [Copidosoma floridanum]|uniref:KH domain-containing, RNA-binding, signal transduction-associated protein 2-like n=1 Tax=Copidosoma floridanum TaxID=29053 RepID=UPI0006C96354|nr:KH domain-containing, RNA-binding, signal transduction-associated protein 2-like [Copidosoma floridanum]